MVDNKSKQIAYYLRDHFYGDPTVQRYWTTDNKRFVDIIKTTHNDNVTYIGTIGGFRRKMTMSTDKKTNISVEFVTAVQDCYTEIMSQTLGFLVFCLDTDNVCYHPGMVVENAIPENNLTGMRHIYLCNPFLWENGLPSLKIENYPTAFLYAMPITDKENELFDQEGPDVFEEYLSKEGIKYFDLKR